MFPMKATLREYPTVTAMTWLQASHHDVDVGPDYELYSDSSEDEEFDLDKRLAARKVVNCHRTM